ncbi:hypothetical protein DFH11DRAFT_936430 [Phellopilus nigrolimitatus]|nr:hypothetical protein DFH11DRAFT_936430 [Phellopilus nigrolimitatus]
MRFANGCKPLQPNNVGRDKITPWASYGPTKDENERNHTKIVLPLLHHARRATKRKDQNRPNSALPSKIHATWLCGDKKFDILSRTARPTRELGGRSSKLWVRRGVGCASSCSSVPRHHREALAARTAHSVHPFPRTAKPSAQYIQQSNDSVSSKDQPRPRDDDVTARPPYYMYVRYCAIPAKAAGDGNEMATSCADASEEGRGRRRTRLIPATRRRHRHRLRLFASRDSSVCPAPWKCRFEQ